MYTVAHMSRVKNTNTGGRIYSATFDTAIENGSVVFLGGLVEGELEIRQALKPTTALISAGAQPMVVMNAEIMYDQSTRAKGALGNFINIANKAFPVIPLEVFDEIELSKEAFVGTPLKGKFATIVNDSTKWNIVDVKPESGFYAEITSVRKSSLPVFIGGAGQKFPLAYDLFTLTFTK